MADLSITAASVIAGTGASTARGTAGSNTTAGQCVYLNTDNLLYLADADVSAAASNSVGIALHGALVGQPLSYLTAGPITIGAATVTAMPYCVSTTAGGIRPISDTSSTNYLCILGYGSNTNSVITVDITATGLAIGADVT